jgi:hypothetical protein
MRITLGGAGEEATLGCDPPARADTSDPLSQWQLSRPEGKAAVAEATEFTIGAKANCSDGPCGEVSRLVIDPAAGTVTHLVITPEHHREAGRFVPVDLVDSAGGQVSVRWNPPQHDQEAGSGTATSGLSLA